MSQDATFEDGAERPLRLRAEDAEDLQVLASLVQDAVLPANEMKLERGKRRFVCLINRFRWEDKTRAERMGRNFERVQALLAIDDVMAIRHQGLDMRDADTILSLLTISFEPGEDGTGQILMTFSGDGAIRADVEAINVTLLDVTRPYLAPSKSAPGHTE